MLVNVMGRSIEFVLRLLCCSVDIIVTGISLLRMRKFMT